MRIAVEPRGEAMVKLVRLGQAEEELRARVGQVDVDARRAGAELVAAREALVELERRAGADGPTAQQRKQAEARLTKAEEAAAAPWTQRHQGAEAAARDGRHALQRHAALHLDELVAEIEENGRAVAEQVDHAAEALLAAIDWRAQVEATLTQVVALTRLMSPGDISRTSTDEVRIAVQGFLGAGGEVGPTVRVTVPA
jgi:hypothetical protein